MRRIAPFVVGPLALAVCSGLATVAACGGGGGATATDDKDGSAGETSTPHAAPDASGASADSGKSTDAGTKPTVNVGTWRSDGPSGVAEARTIWGVDANLVFIGGRSRSGSPLVVSRKPRDGGLSWGVEHDAGESGRISGISGTGPTYAIAVGDTGSAGLALKYDGTGWTPLAAPSSPLYAVWCRAVNDAFAVTSGARVLHYDGNQWTTSHAGTRTSNLTAVFGVGAHVFAVGRNVIAPDGGPSAGALVVHFDGAKWTDELVMTGADGLGFLSVWGAAPNDVFAAGERGILWHYDGVRWREVSIPKSGVLRGLWGSGPADVFAVGVKPEFFRFDGVAWAVDTSDVPSDDFQAVWGSGPTDVWAVAEQGKVAHRTP